jgi:rubrerythrin
MSGPHRHSHHSDQRAAFRVVRRHQAKASLVTLLAAALLLLAPPEAPWKLPALVLAGVAYGVFSNRNWRCPQCRSILPYGRVPAEFTCPRCDAVLEWRHPPP